MSLPLSWIHGDVSGHPVKKLPEGLRPVAHGTSFVVRRGETTGHRHLMTMEKADDVNIYLDPATGLHVFEVFNAVEISHAEHKTLVIEPGIFIEKAEQEYNPFEKQLQSVQD